VRGEVAFDVRRKTFVAVEAFDSLFSQCGLQSDAIQPRGSRWLGGKEPRNAQHLHAYAQSYFQAPFLVAFDVRRKTVVAVEAFDSLFSQSGLQSDAIQPRGSRWLGGTEPRNAQHLHAYAQSYFRARIPCSFRREEQDLRRCRERCPRYPRAYFNATRVPLCRSKSA